MYDAHWADGELVVETDEPARLVQGDTLWVELTFSEGMDDTIRVTLEGPYAGLPFVTVRWDSMVHPRDRWVGRYPLVTWDSIRNLMAGERRLVIWAEDAVTRNALDTNPATAAYWDDEAEQWVGYEGDDGLLGQTGGHDRVHRVRIAPWNHVCLLVDASSSMNLDNWYLSQVRSPQRLVGWMRAQEESADYQVAAWRFYSSSVEQLAGYGFELDDAQAALWMAVPQFQGTNEPGQPNPANPPGGIAMTDVETAVLQARAYAAGEYDDPPVICVWSDFWHNLGSADSEVEATYQAVAESSVVFLFTNPGAMYGSQCTAVQQEAAWRSGGGYYEGFSASQVESLYRVIPRVWRSRAMGAQMNGSGSDTIGVWVDSTMTRLEVMASLAPWSERGMARRSRACVVRPPTQG